jgi:hypothetical protein
VPGLLIDGALIPVPGATVLSPHDEPWVKLAPNDFGKRPGRPHQIIIHTTGGVWPQKIVPRAPRAGSRAEQIARYWSSNGTPGGAPLIVDGTEIACLVDLVRFQGYHATKCNPYSVGIEMVQEPDGAIGSDTLDTTVALVLVLCDVLGIPLQGDGRPWRSNVIVERLRFGGPDAVGVFGHNQMAWKFPEWLTPEKRAAYPNGYADRGHGDPGDEIFARLRSVGMMFFDFDKRQELAWWMPVQRALGVVADGVCGRFTSSALKQRGAWNRGVFLERPVP